MSGAGYQRIRRLLASATFATWLIVFIGAWSLAASLVPQGDLAEPAVASWVGTHAVAESIVRTLGLHRAFSSPIFLACVSLLAVSMSLCSWDRTKSAAKRARQLRSARVMDAQQLASDHDVEVSCSHRDPEAVLSVASETMADLGINTRRTGGILSAVSHPWAVWGSPLFHWSLVLVMLAVVLGALQSSYGLMGLAVGQQKTNAPASYGLIHAGPLHDWNVAQRIIRVDSMVPRLFVDGLDRGPLRQSRS